MIVVKIEIHPGGDSRQAREIGRILIANVSGLAEDSSYIAEVKTEGSEDLGIAPVNKRLNVKGHQRSAGVLRLLARVLNLSVHGEDL